MTAIFKNDEQGLAIEDLKENTNLDELLTDEQSDAIAALVITDYDKDKQSRTEWDETAKEWRELAMQVAKQKSFPWPGASNVKFPLLTIAALQFASRAYPALVRPPTLVRMRVNGADPDNQKRKRARRVAEHMSWQLIDQDESWEEHHDKLLTVLPIAGLAYKKSYFCRRSGHNKSELCLPHEVMVNYWATNLDDATITHTYTLPHRSVVERQREGFYSDKDLENPQSPPETAAGEREKRSPYPSDDQHFMLEQHRWLDLDNDGLEEPYVVTVDHSSAKVLRIQNRFQAVMANARGKITRVIPKHYFTKYGFLPAPDGSFYEMGFGCLLGPINESVNSLINQIIDAGTMQVGSRGFIGRGARFQGGQIRFKHPFEWIRVNTSGSALKDNIVPLPVNPPSPVLFQLLGLLVQYGQQVSSVTEMMQGKNPGQNTPAYNMRELLNQGMQVFTGIFKRVFRNQRDEYRKLYLLNRDYLNPEEYFTFGDEQQQAYQQDYIEADPKDLSPNADPNQALRESRVQMSSMVLERAQMVPGYNQAEVERDWLESIEHPNADRIYPLDENGNPAIPPPANPEIEVKLAEEQRRQLEGMQRGRVQEMEAMTKAMVGEAQVLELQTRAQLNLAKAEAEGNLVAIELFKTQLQQISEKRQGLEALIKDSTERMKIEQQSNANSGNGD